jgi:hypothetical protein
LLNQFGHPDVPLRDWNAFRVGFSRFYLDEVINRDEVPLPEWFMPLARGVAIPSDALLRKLGDRDFGCYWVETNSEVFRMQHMTYYLQVRRCSDDNLWTVERINNAYRPTVDEVLVFCFGATPIFARTHASAMQLAMSYNFSKPPSGLRWMKSPDDLEGFEHLVKLARARRLEEHGAVPSGDMIKSYEDGRISSLQTLKKIK